MTTSDLSALRDEIVRAAMEMTSKWGYAPEPLFPPEAQALLEAVRAYRAALKPPTAEEVIAEVRKWQVGHYGTSLTGVLDAMSKRIEEGRA